MYKTLTWMESDEKKMKRKNYSQQQHAIRHNTKAIFIL